MANGDLYEFSQTEMEKPAKVWQIQQLKDVVSRVADDVSAIKEQTRDNVTRKQMMDEIAKAKKETLAESKRNFIGALASAILAVGALVWTAIVSRFVR